MIIYKTISFSDILQRMFAWQAVSPEMCRHSFCSETSFPLSIVQEIFLPFQFGARAPKFKLVRISKHVLLYSLIIALEILIIYLMEKAILTGLKNAALSLLPIFQK